MPLHRFHPPSSSPCLRLNDDILREIFIHCIYYDFLKTTTRFHLFNDEKQQIRELPQLSVSQVCSSWRYVALLTPRLWDNIYIGDLTEANLRIAKEYLSRAANRPISISLKRHEIADESWRSQVIDFLSSYRIRYVDISNIQLILPDLPQRSVADLEELVLLKSRLDEDEDSKIDLNDTRYPKLARVSFSGIRITSVVSTSLRIFIGTGVCMTVTEGWDILSRCPSLETCYLWVIRGNSRLPVSVPQIHLQHLHKLALYPDTQERDLCFSIFMEALALPVIERLDVVCDRLAMPAFQSLARRSNHFPYLTDLILRYPNSVADVGALLALTPSLTRISLSHSDAAIFDNLALNGLASGSLAPRLQSLKLGDVLSNLGLFFDMVESRMKNAQTSSNGVPAPLTEVTLFLQDRHDYDRLENMRQRGIPISAS